MGELEKVLLFFVIPLAIGAIWLFICIILHKLEAITDRLNQDGGDEEMRCGECDARWPQEIPWCPQCGARNEDFETCGR